MMAKLFTKLPIDVKYLKIILTYLQAKQGTNFATSEYRLTKMRLEMMAKLFTKLPIDVKFLKIILRHPQAKQGTNFATSEYRLTKMR